MQILEDWNIYIQNVLKIGWFSCQCSTTSNGQRKESQKPVCTMPKKWHHLRPNSSRDIGASWSPHQKLHGRTPRKMRYCRIADGWHVQVSPTRYFHRQNQCRLDSWGEDEEITKVLSTTRRFSSRPYWQAVCHVFTIAFASGMRGLTARRVEDEEQIDLDLEQLTKITQKKKVSQARGDSMLQLTENRETVIRKAFEQASFARAVENRQFYNTNESVMDGNSSTLLCRENSEPINSQSSRLQAVVTDHVKIGAVTGHESIQICRNFGDWSTSTVTTTRKFDVLGANITRNWTTRTTIYSYRDW